DAGELFGLTPGTVLAVHPPAGQGKATDVLGFVKVVAARPLAADAETCSDPRDGAPMVLPTPAEKLPEAARCSVLLRDFGERRIKLAVERADDSLAGKDPDRAKLIGHLSAALEALAPEIREMVRAVYKEADAEWVLRLQETKEGPRAVLRPGEGRKV